jgi:ketosteroid isomerase-like protein
MNILGAAICLSLWNASSSANVIRVDWSAAAGVEAPIAGVRREYVTAFNAHLDTVDAMYTSDAVAIFSDGAHVASAGSTDRQSPLASGAAAIVSVTLTPRQFIVSGDTGSEAGTFTETSVVGERSTTVEGMYVTIYARGSDGRWRIAMEVRTRGGRPPLAVW